MQTIIHLQVIIGCAAALFMIAAAVSMAIIMIAGIFKRNWPPDWFSNVLCAACLIAFGFGIAEGFLALTRYATGSL